MSLTNTSKPTTTYANIAKPNLGETWASITTTWATEDDTWQTVSSLLDNGSKVSAFTIVTSSANTGATSPGTVEDDSSRGTVAWTNPENAAANDGNSATVTLTNPSTTHYLKATNFGFSIPSDATITGVIAEHKATDSAGAGNVWDVVKLVKDGVVDGTNHRPVIDSSGGYVSTGSSSDLWGLTLNPEDVNSADFGVAYSEQPPGTKTFTVNHIRLTVYYTEPAISYNVTNTSKP